MVSSGVLVGGDVTLGVLVVVGVGVGVALVVVGVGVGVGEGQKSLPVLAVKQFEHVSYPTPMDNIVTEFKLVCSINLTQPMKSPVFT